MHVYNMCICRTTDVVNSVNKAVQHLEEKIIEKLTRFDKRLSKIECLITARDERAVSSEINHRTHDR